MQGHSTKKHDTNANHDDSGTGGCVLMGCDVGNRKTSAGKPLNNGMKLRGLTLGAGKHDKSGDSRLRVACRSRHLAHG